MIGVDLNDFFVHGKATAAIANDAVQISAPGGQWHYVVSFPLLRYLSTLDQIGIEIELDVSAGILGAGCTDTGLTRDVSGVPSVRECGRNRLLIIVDPNVNLALSPPVLVFRNWSAEEVKATIYSILIKPLEEISQRDKKRAASQRYSYWHYSFDLGDEVQPNGRHVLVTTPPAIWAYAAHLLFEGRPLPETGERLFRIDLWVNQGTVDVGVAGSDGQFIAHEMRSVDYGRTAVNLRLKVEDRPNQIVVRNAGRFAAKVIVERVQFYRLLTNPLAGVASASAPATISRQSKSLGEAFDLAKPARGDPAQLVSLILTVKDGLPHLPKALESVRCQTYGEIELVVQDCLSTDGSSELLASFDGAEVNLTREADGGIGDANYRAMARCRGDIIGSIDSDNLLEPDAVACAVEYLSTHPEKAVVYGSVRMISAEGGEESVFRPGPYDFLRLVTCELVPPWSTSFFNRAVCGPSFRFDPQMKTCADFDIWLRLSHLPIAFLDKVAGSTRLNANSMTCRPESYEQFCRDKAFALIRYAETCTHEPLRAALIRHGMVGIYCWAAESVKRLAPDRTDLIVDHFKRANAVDPDSARVALAAGRLFVTPAEVTAMTRRRRRLRRR